ncbi:MAG: ATP-dependent helicase HrpB [Xanthobacteraceae bacterium]
MTTPSPLPIDTVLPELCAALRTGNTAVLVAPPGAGKTTRVPLVLSDQDWARGKRILVLEPRRLAARAAAERMAQTRGERLGETIGLRVRFGSKVSKQSRIEIVTEGIFSRRVIDDPMLDGVAAVLFDEFHERSLDADLGLALARDVQQGLRPDLRLLVMSATIDAARIAALLGEAPVIESLGRSFPVETRYVGRNMRPIEPQVADTVARAMRAERGSLLAFLPGAAEIRRSQALLEGRIDSSVDIVALYGALSGDAQVHAIAPALSGRRKIVLATSIAETSITIEGVRIVVDSGLARVPRYEPAVGITRLDTVRASRAAADQRRGRAGRTEPGICYRLWDEPQTAALEPYAKPEILAADLSAFALDLAAWGSTPEQLAFLDPPPRAALAEAKALLTELRAIDADGRVTDQGRHLRSLPLPPRLARMVVGAAGTGRAQTAARIALLVGERGLGGDDVDLRERLHALDRDRTPRARDACAMAARWAELAKPSPERGGLDRRRRSREEGSHADTTPTRRASLADLPLSGREISAGCLLALAYPERIAKNRADRGGETGAFVLANGRGAGMDPSSALAREPLLAVAELVGSATSGRILLAAPITLGEIEIAFADRIETRDEISFDAASAGLRGRRSRRLGALVLAEQPMPVEPSEENAQRLAAGLAGLGIDRLPWSKTLRQWRDRIMFLRARDGEEWPDMSDAALAKNAGEWLAPGLVTKTRLDDFAADELASLLHQSLPWSLRQRLDNEAPTHFVAPTGSQVPIDYAAEGGPKIAIRLQELFGVARHPAIGGGKVPLVIELLSPAQRPVQTTRDLPGFWRGSYAAVRSEMRGRYPKHPWPEDPIAATATRRAKPRIP